MWSGRGQRQLVVLWLPWRRSPTPDPTHPVPRRAEGQEWTDGHRGTVVSVDGRAASRREPTCLDQDGDTHDQGVDRDRSEPVHSLVGVMWLFSIILEWFCRWSLSRKFLRGHLLEGWSYLFIFLALWLLLKLWMEYFNFSPASRYS